MKKIYTKIVLRFIIAISVFNSASCQEYHIDSQAVDTLELEMDAKESYLFTCDPATFTFNLSSGTVWSIESDQQWCTVTPSTSSFSSLVEKITVTLEANEKWKEREAVLTVTAEGIAEARTISVKQAGRDGFVVIPFEGEIAKEGGVAEFYIMAAKSWEISGASNFLSFDKESGEGNEEGIIETIKVTVAPNTGVARIGTFAIKTGTHVEKFSVRQNGMKLELTDPEMQTISLNKNDKQTLVDINANVEWEVVYADEWIAAEKIDNQQLQLTYKLNKLFIDRTGKVELKPKQIPDAEPVVIEITQASDIYTIATSPLITFDSNTGWVKVAGTDTTPVKTTNLFAGLPYTFAKGHITIELEELNLNSSAANLFFNFDGSTSVPGGRLTLKLEKNNKGVFTPRVPKSINGSEKTNIPITYTGAPKKIEFIQETKPNDDSKSLFRLLINGAEVASYEEVNGWEETLKFGMYIQAKEFTNQDSYVIKSVEYEPF